MIFALHIIGQHAPLHASKHKNKKWAAGVRKHGDVLQYSLQNDSDVMVVRTRDAFYRCLRLRGWRLSDWLASLDEQQRRAAKQARSQACALCHDDQAGTAPQGLCWLGNGSAVCHGNCCSSICMCMQGTLSDLNVVHACQAPAHRHEPCHGM